MWFLIKVAFWFSLVLIMLPVLDQRPADSSNSAPQVGVGEAVNAASEVISYVSAICLEKPDVCIKGAQSVQALGHRAKEGARVAYDLLDDQFADDKKPVLEPELVTGSVAASNIPVPVARPKR